MIFLPALNRQKVRAAFTYHHTVSRILSVRWAVLLSAWVRRQRTAGQGQTTPIRGVMRARARTLHEAGTSQKSVFLSRRATTRRLADPKTWRQTAPSDVPRICSSRRTSGWHQPHRLLLCLTSLLRVLSAKERQAKHEESNV